MAVPIVRNGDFVKIRQAAKNDAQYALNILHFVADNAIGAPVTIADVAIWFDANVSAPFKAVISNAATCWGYGASNAPPGLAWSLEWYAAANRGIGTGGAGLLPTQAAPLISWRSDVPDARGRGRTYLPFTSPTCLDASAALTGAFKALINTWINTITGVNTIPNAGGTGTIDIHHIITGALHTLAYAVLRRLIRNYMATQRRREELNRVDADPFAGSFPA